MFDPDGRLAFDGPAAMAIVSEPSGGQMGMLTGPPDEITMLMDFSNAPAAQVFRVEPHIAVVLLVQDGHWP